MKVLSVGKHLYAVQSASFTIPVFRHVRENAGAHADPETDTLARYTDTVTNTFMIAIPWMSVTRFDPQPSGLEELCPLDPDTE